MKIVFTGGGSGGHIFPIISIVKELKKIFPESSLNLFFIGPKDKKYEGVLKREGFHIMSVLSGKVRRYFGLIPFLQNAVDLGFKIPFGFLQSFFILLFNRPKLVFSKGGYGAIPITLAARFLRIPVFFHESDIISGMANKKIASFASKIFISFENTEGLSGDNVVLVGNPLREELFNGDKKEAKELFNIKTENPVILIMGGSLGSTRVNDEIFEVAGSLLKNFELIHQTGEKNFREFKKETIAILSKEEQDKYHIYPFLDEKELKSAYAISNFVVSRAGAGTIFQLAACGKPSILIPLPESAQNHQVKNAYAYAKNGAALVIEEKNFSSHYFLKLLTNLINNKESLEKLSQSALAFSKPNASKVIAQYINEYLLK
jgi:UDP-N-acetylglucosamine--N-acetylmuramyl-(pentapeptide) pyrophosphoryl-undecaprenol N-acetylglucosamine transferase